MDRRRTGDDGYDPGAGPGTAGRDPDPALAAAYRAASRWVEEQWSDQFWSGEPDAVARAWSPGPRSPRTMAMTRWGDQILAAVVSALLPPGPRPAADDEVRAILARACTSVEDDLREAVARHPMATAEVMAALCDDPQATVREQAAIHPRTPVDAAVRVAERPWTSHETRLRVLERPDLREPVRALLVAATNCAPLADERRSLAGRSSDARVLRLLLESSSGYGREGDVREALLGNPALPLDVVIPLTRGADKPLRASARAAAADRDWPEVRAALRRGDRQNLPRLLDGVVGWAERAGADPEPRLRAAAATSLPLPMAAALLGDADPLVRRALAARRDEDEAVADLLLRLSSDSDPAVRAAVGRNPRTPAAVLTTLATDPATSVRLQVARAAGLPDEGRQHLARDPAWEVAAAALAWLGEPAT